MLMAFTAPRASTPDGAEGPARPAFEAPGGYAYPLVVGPTKRYLVDQKGKPFFLAGDAAWSLFAQLSEPDAEFYLTARQQRGFTAVMANLIEHKFSNNAPRNRYGIAPFTGAPFRTPNDAYFSHADYIIQAAARRGILVLLAPLYLGSGCGGEGWCEEVKRASTDDLNAWGRYVGTRYKDYDNIVWMIGGDAEPSPVLNKVQAMVDGILSVDTRHLFTAHNASGQMAVDPWPRASWLGVNNVYTYSTSAYTTLLGAYNRSPVMPYFFLETAYENESPNGPPATPQQLRAESYWAVLAGAFGHIFGNCPIWNFDWPDHGAYCPETGWRAQLGGVGSINIQRWQKLFTARHWYALVPDESHSVMTSGMGSGTDFAMAAAASDGSSIIAYLPSPRPVTVNLASLTGPTAKAWWYNPATGTSASIGSYSTSGGAQLFTPPPSGDWVLVIDSDAAGFPPP